MQARDLNDLVEYVRSLQLEIVSLRQEFGDLTRGAPLPELDFSPKVIYFSGDQQLLQYPWSVSCKSGSEEILSRESPSRESPSEEISSKDFGSKDLKQYHVVPNDQCELEVIDPSGAPCVEIRDDSLVPLRIGRSMLKVNVPFPTRDSVFTIEVKYP